MKKTFFILSAVITAVFFLPPFGGEGGCQNISINTTGATADVSALLDIVSADKGALIPRVALASATTTVTIASPAASLLVYNDGTGGLGPAGYYFNYGTSGSPFWVPLLDAPTAVPALAWQTLGNAATVWNTNFLGTTDNVSLRFRTNNTPRMIIDSVGNVGIGTTSPNNRLSITSGKVFLGVTTTAYGSIAGLVTFNMAIWLTNGTQGGSAFTLPDILYGGGTLGTYIMNGLRLDGDVLVESGKVGGNSNPPAGLLHIFSPATTNLSIYEQASNDADAYDLNFRKARGTVAVPTVISAADELGTIAFRGFVGGATYVTGAAIKAISEGTIASTRVPAHLSFWTGTDAAPTVLTERMRINSAGNAGIADQNPKSTLSIGGSAAGKYRAGNTITMTSADFFINLTGAGACTLPAASSVAAGTIVIICNTTASDIALNRSGSDTMCNIAAVAGCGKTTVTVPANNNAVRYFSDGAGVWVGW